MSSAVVDATRRVADELVRPAAERVETEGVPRSHLDALAAAGACAPLDPVTFREVAELIAGADVATWLVWAQHASVVRQLGRVPGDGDLAAIAFSHLRRTPPPVTATPTGSGWSVTGQVAWLTSWGLADVLLLAAVDGDDVVWALLPTGALADHVTSTPLRLAAMAGTHTVGLTLAGVPVPRSEVVTVQPLAEWRSSDDHVTAGTNPAVFGLTAEAVRRLRQHASDRDEPAAATLAGSIDAELRSLRSAAYGMADELAPGDGIADRLEVKAAAGALACRATAGLVAAGSGRAMSLDASAQRLARAALFLLVQGQTAAVREVTLRRLAHG